MANWPSTLPKPLLAGNQLDAGSNVLRTEFDAGAARQRLRYGDTQDALAVSWRFKSPEMAIFKAFWSADINKGTDWFLMDMDIGDGLNSYEVRFIGGKYQSSQLSKSIWHVSANFDVRAV